MSKQKSGVIYSKYLPMDNVPLINGMSKEEIRNLDPEYYDFMEKYKEAHCCCPKCGSKHLTSTLVGYAFNREHPEEYVDYNSNVCMDCGWSGITDDLVPEKH